MAEDAYIENLARILSRRARFPNCDTRSPMCHWNIVEQEDGLVVVTLGFECKKRSDLWEQTVRVRPSSGGGGES